MIGDIFRRLSVISQARIFKNNEKLKSLSSLKNENLKNDNHHVTPAKWFDLGKKLL